MTDNHGAWTLGCYGNSEIRTPHIDRLAQQGTLFEQAFACNPVCSPTRASVLTGLMPSQHGVHCYLRSGRLQIGPEARNTLADFTSLPEILTASGYRCGLVGKWHLGANLTAQESLDDYWITMPHGGTSTFYNAAVIEDGRQRREPEYLTDFWTRHAVQFLQQSASQEEPFFLFLSYNGPYALSRLLLEDGRNRHADYYQEQPLTSFPRQPAHPWQFANRDFINNPTSIRRVATEVSGIDDGVGTVMDTLQQLGLDENTVVIFLADQGWVGGHGGFFGMGDHTRPVTARDGMMQIPMIWRHPQKIAAGRRSHRLVASYDILPTLLDWLQLNPPADTAAAATPKSPGTSFADQFRNIPSPTASAAAPASAAEEAVFYEFEQLRCVRTRNWKFVQRHPAGPDELYHLESDPDEFTNLVSDPQQAAVRQHLQQRLTEFFQQYAEPKYDLWNGGGSQTVLFHDETDRAASATSTGTETAATAAATAAISSPSSDGFAPQQLQLPEGFSSQLVAGPPLVTHPTLGCFDDRGQLYVCNNAGVNMTAEELEAELPNSIHRLVDSDGDGVFDQSTVFADKMTFPMGAAWHDGALFVASPPNIWRLEDTDNDGVADRRDVLVDKFGYTGNAASIHGCFNGPDGRLYWCDGYHGHEFRDEQGNLVSQRKGSYIFSCRPDGSDVLIHCGGGMDNPVEVDLTDTGDVIGTVNILYTRPRVDALVHWQYGGAYPHREAVLDELKVTGELLGPIHRFGHVAVSGTTRYRSGVIDHRWRDNYFVTQFNLGKVVRMELARQGSSYTATQREFLSCSNRDFHPTDVIEDADGSLLVVDTGGWFYRGCPTSQMSKPDILGGIYRIRRDGMTTVPDPRGQQLNWSEMPSVRLVRMLNDTRYAVREQAIQECVGRSHKIVPALARAVRTADVQIRLNAVWALTRIIGQTAADDSAATAATNQAARAALRPALSDREADIRQAACYALTVNPDPDFVTDLTGCLRDESLAVRRQAAAALGRVTAVAAVPELVQLLDSTDRELVHAAVYALIEINDPQAILSATGSQSELPPATAIRSHIARQQIDPANYQTSGAPVSDWPTDPQLQRELLQHYQRYADHSTRMQQVAGTLSKAFDQLISQPDRYPPELVTEFVAAFAGVEAVAQRVEELLSVATTSAEVRQSLLQGIAGSQSVTPSPRLQALVSAELKAEDPQRVAQAVQVAAALDTREFDQVLQTIAADSSADALLRVAALEAAEHQRGQLSEAAFQLLLSLLKNGSPTEASRAIQTLSVSRLTAPQLRELAPELRDLGPQQLQDLIRPYQRDLPTPAAQAVLTALEGSRSLSNLPMIELSEVVKRFPPELHQRANALLDRLHVAEQQQLRKLDQVVAELPQADAAAGRQLFFSEQAKCTTCHKVGSEGKAVGPDLTTIGANRSSHDLLESIMFPSASIVRQYEPYTVITESGRSYSGLIVRESSAALHVQQATGDTVVVERAEIDELIPATVSIMPQGLDEQLTPRQIADLVAWLMQQR